MNLVDEIKEKIDLEIRPNSKIPEYMEAVVRKENLESLIALLTNHLGPAAKRPGVEPTLPEEIGELVDQLGGLRIEQSFYYKKNDHDLIYAALWPWQSNPDRITLKCGLVSCVSK